MGGRFFEGWYYRVTLPQIGQSFAFMYSLEDPAGSAYQGGAIQVLGPDDSYQWRSLPNLDLFWASYSRLALAHWRHGQAPARYLAGDNFFKQVSEGYQASDRLNQGAFLDVTTGQWTRWYYQIQPVYTWGKPLGGWLSFLSIADPGWQVLLAYGQATGWIEWQGQVYDFQAAPAYIEKNWGGSFPRDWFWLQCNSFVDAQDLAVTAGGGERDLLWWQERLGMVGIHYQGKFYEFDPWQSKIRWQIKPWGEWYVQATRADYQVTLRGWSDRPGSPLRTPTKNGLVWSCRETLLGNLTLRLSQGNQLIIEAHSHLAGLEVGVITSISQKD